MRNLKKVLSLALAMVMLLGMMVVGAGAATSFKDDSSIPENRAVAVAVANKIEVLLGDENGNFNPNDTLTRAEAAVVLAKLDLGASAASALTATNAATFNDVGTGYGWAKAYIDYCAGNGYMVGVGGNNFAPGRTLTSVEFATMVSRVLGYKDENEYGKDGWTAVKAAALARKAGLGADVAVANADMTRADMAQMVFNALTAPMVEYKGMNVSIGDATFNTPATPRYHDVNSDLTYNDTYDGKAPTATTTIKLCEEKFPYLKLVEDSDVFGRATKEWRLRNIAIAGTETPVAADYTFTSLITKKADVEKVTGKVYFHTTTSTPAENTELWTNGDLSGIYGSDALQSIVNLTGDGVVVELYMNERAKNVIDKVVVIETTKATVTQVNTAKENFRISFKTYNDYEGTSKNEIIDNESDFVGLIDEVKKDDILAVVANSDGDVLDLYVPEVTEGYVTYVQKDNTLATVDGSTVKGYGDKTRKELDDVFKDTLHQDVKAYMVNGYALAVTGAKVTPKVAGENYIYVTNIWTEGPDKNSTSNTTKVEGILSTGKVATLTLPDTTSFTETSKDSWKGATATLVPQVLAKNVTLGTKGTPDAGTEAAAGEALYVNTGDSTNKFDVGKITTNLSASDDAKSGSYFLNKVYKYYDYDGDTQALKGTSVLVVPGDDVSVALSNELRSNTATLSMTNNTSNKKYISDDVVMIWIDKDGNATVSGRKTISGDNQGDYYAVTEGSNSVTVIFVSKSTWISDTAVYVAHIYDGWQEYTDKNGKTKQDGWKVGYYVNGEEDEKIMTTSTEPKEATFYTITENGEAYDIKSEGARYCNVVARPVAGSNKAIEAKGEYYNLANAAIIDTRVDDNGNLLEVKYQISQLSDLLDLVKTTSKTVKVSLHMTNGSVDTIYLVSDNAGKAEVDIGAVDGSNNRTVTVESSGSFEVDTPSNNLVIEAGGTTHTISDAQNKTGLKCFAGVYNEPGQYDGKSVTFTAYKETVNGDVVANTPETYSVTQGYGSCVFYYEAATVTAWNADYWQITSGDDVIAEGEF